MITSIQERRFQLFSQTMPSHHNHPLVIDIQAYRAIPLVASVGQPRPQRSTLLTIEFRNYRQFFTALHTLTP